MAEISLEPGALNFLSPEEMDDPTISIKRLFAGNRCQRYDKYEPPFYVLSRFEDVNHVLMNPTRFLSGPGQGPNFIEPMGIVSDPPMHTFFRKLVQEDFKPGSIARLRPRLEEIADELLDKVEGISVWDLHDDLAFPLPVIIICEILGIPTDDIEQFKSWSDTSVEALSAPDPTPYEEEIRRMRAYIVDLVRTKRSDLADKSLIARIARAKRDDGSALSDEDAVGIINQLFVAGNETTTSLITNFMMRMLGEGYLWADFCAGRIERDRAINESLRLDPPLLAMFRTTAGEEEIDGQRIPAHTKVMIHYAAANRDPSIFDNPHTFDPSRPIQKILTFALGIHFCVGAELARLEAEVTIEALRRRCPTLEMVDEGERIGPFLFWGRRKLPVRNSGG